MCSACIEMNFLGEKDWVWKMRCEYAVVADLFFFMMMVRTVQYLDIIFGETGVAKFYKFAMNNRARHESWRNDYLNGKEANI